MIKQTGLDKKTFDFEERVEIDVGAPYGKLLGKVAGIASRHLTTTWIVVLDAPLMDGATAVAVHESLMVSLQTDSGLNEVERDLVMANQPIHAIKAFRTRTGGTLALAKQLVDGFRAR